MFQKIIVGQNFSENFNPRTKVFRKNNLGQKFSEKICPRIKIFKNFCPMWGRTNFIRVGQKFSEKISVSHGIKIF